MSTELFRVVVIGDSGVGKSNLLSRFIQGNTNPKHVRTRSVVVQAIGEGKDTPSIKVNKKTIRAEIADTAGLKRLTDVRTDPVFGSKKVDGILLVYDITKHSTFKNINQWLKEFRECFADSNDAVIMLVGNKSDLKDERAVTNEEAKHYAEINGLEILIETSTVDPTYVKAAFWTILKKIYYRSEPVDATAFDGGDWINETIDLKRNEAGDLGITIRGGVDNPYIEDGNPGIFVTELISGTPAEADGHLQLGDQIISINGQSLKAVSHMVARKTLQDSGREVHLKVRRKKGHVWLPAFGYGTFCSWYEVKPSDLVDITLFKNQKGLGITIEGGQGSWYNKIDVKSVVAKGAADEEGSLEVKDTIIKVDGISIVDVTHKEAVDAFKSVQKKVVLTVEMKNFDTNNILEHPQHVACKPGEKVELSIRTKSGAKMYKWFFRRKQISSDDQYIEGSTKHRLIIKKFLPKHKGAYKCVITDLSNKSYTSRRALLKIDGELIGPEELTLLGDILSRTTVDFTAYGIDVHKLHGSLTYEEMQFVLSGDPATESLSQNLKDKLKSRLKEEVLYREAIAGDQSVSLAYVKILALGPGQVGKSTFLYRLMGIMKGNIETADPKTQPQSSTGISEQREACIQYESRAGALTSSKKWQVFEENAELEIQLGGLMSLISEQTEQSLQEQDSLPISQATADDLLKDEILKSAMSVKETNPEDVGLSDKRPMVDDIKEMIAIEKEKGPRRVVKKRFSRTRRKVANPQPELLQPTYTTNVLSPIEIDTIIGEHESILDECRLSTAQIKPDMLLNIADIGGQPAFLEMLPSLTIGPALYLVFMSLVKGLETRYPVLFKCKDNRGQVLCQNYTYTSEEVIFTALSSIASFGNSDQEVEMYVLKEDSQQQTNSLALLVGTFADKVNAEEVASLHSQIKQKVQETDHYQKKNLLYDTKFLEVNNLSARDDEILMQRSLIEGLLRDKFRKYQIPTRWLMLSICLKLVAKKLKTFELSFKDTIKIGSKFGMTEETVRAALKFLHKYIGLVMYFPNHPHLKDVVICDPQIVFSSVSELIFDIYDPSKKYVPEAKYDHFVETGCFSPQDITPVGKQTKTNVLSIDTIVKLLVHLNIAAEVPSSRDETSLQSDETPSTSTTELPNPRKEYFLPAVLQTADTSLLRLGCIEENDELAPEPLCIRFITGYVPLGFVCALSANLMANNKLLKLIPFKEGDQSFTYKNMMKFRYNGVVDIIMVSGPKYCEFHIRRWSKTATIEFWDSNCCPHIKDIIFEAAKKVVQSMQHGDSVYKLSNCFELAFKCPEHKNAEVGHEPLARFVHNDSAANALVLKSEKKEPNTIQCVNSKCFTSSPLTPAMKMWFGKDIPLTPLEIIKQPTAKDNVIRIKVEGTKPIKYQWFKDDEELTDGDDFKGSTGHELFVRNSDSRVKGKYHCKLEDRHGDCVSSGNIKFDPFMIELEHGGLDENEIHAIIDINGFRSMEDLKMLSVDDIKDLDGLRAGGKIRVKRFLKQSLQQDELNSGSSLKLKHLKDVFWEVRANWYLLGIQLDVEHPDLEIAGRKIEVYDKYMSVLKSFLERKSPPPSWVNVKLALESVIIGRRDFDLPREVQEELKQLSSDTISASDAKPNKASRLRKVLTVLWKMRAQWRRLAGEIEQITEDDCEAISANHSSVEDCFAALLHKCLTLHQNLALQVLLNALRSRVVGRDDIADEFEKEIEAGCVT